jgi:homoserine/homoserine lactone efflux protein
LGARAARALHSRDALWLNRACGATLLGLAAVLAGVRRAPGA